MFERMAMLVNNPANSKYSDANINNNETLIKVCTPLINYTISPMIYGPWTDDDTNGDGVVDELDGSYYLYPRVGRAVVVVPRVYPEPPPEDASEFEAFYSTKIAEGPTKRPYNTGGGANTVYKVINVVNTTPYEYFECHHLTVATMGDHWQILGGDNPLFNAEVTASIPAGRTGEVKLGYSRYTNVKPGDQLPKVHWMQEFDQEGGLIDIKRPCVNYLLGDTIELKSRCLVQQTAGGVWTVVAVEC